MNIFIVTFFLFCSDGSQSYSAVGPMSLDTAESYYAAFTVDPYVIPSAHPQLECKFDFVQIKEYRHKI